MQEKWTGREAVVGCILMKYSREISIVLCLLTLASWFYVVVHTHQSQTSQLDHCESVYSHINPNIDCSQQTRERITEIESEIRNLVDSIKEEKDITRISVFYRDIRSKNWFGIEENEHFAPGSLLKLPLAITLFKKAEIDSSFLGNHYQYKSIDATLYEKQNFAPLVKLTKGQEYSVDELISRMIQYSDNAVVPLLSNLVEKPYFDKVFLDLGVKLPSTGGAEQDFVSVKTYASILRTLYNSSYLNPTYSEKLLSIMTGSGFREGIIAGIPKEVVVANKFGERQIFDEKSKKMVLVELHDCGIIYHPERPYILCIMTRGKNFADLKGALSEISNTIYEKQ